MNREKLSKRFKASNQGYSDGFAIAKRNLNWALPQILNQGEKGAKLIYHSDSDRAIAYSAAFVAGYMIGIINEHSVETPEE